MDLKSAVRNRDQISHMLLNIHERLKIVETATSTEIQVEDIIVDGVTTKAPSQNIVYDALNLKEDKVSKGVSNGYASLDSGGKVPVSQLPNSIMEYKGLYNASTNIPTLVDGIGNTGDVYKTTVAGLGVNSLNFKVSDYAIYNGTIWEKSKGGADDVNSVFGRAGAVVAQSGDYTTALVTEATNKNYQTDSQKLYNDATSSIQTQLNSKESSITASGSITDFWSGNKTFRDLATDVRNVVLTGFNSAITWARVTTSTTLQNAISLLQKQSNYLQVTRFISGTGVTINADTTKFDIQVVGEIVDPITFIPTNINVNTTGILATYRTTQTESFVWVDSTGTVIQSLVPPDTMQLDSIIGYWVLIHSNLSTINIINSFPYYADGIGTKFNQLLYFLGFSKFKGTNIVSPGTTGTRVTHTGGNVLKSGIGNTTKRPVLSLIGAVDSTFRMRNQNDVEGADTQTLDVLNIDVAGVTTALANNNRFGACKVWKFSSGLIRIQRGQYSYANYDEASVGIFRDPYVDSPNGLRNGIHIGWIIFRRNTSWGTGGTGTNGVDYSFRDVTSTGVTGSVTPTLQTSYNISLIPQIETNAGAVTFKEGGANNTIKVLAVQNLAGTETASIDGNGAVIGTSWNGYTPANDANVIHTTGNETIGGAKTINNNVYTRTNYFDFVNSYNSVSNNRTVDNVPLSIQNNFGGIGFHFDNQSLGWGGYGFNQSIGTLLALDSKTGSLGDLLQFSKNEVTTGGIKHDGSLYTTYGQFGTSTNTTQPQMTITNGSNPSVIEFPKTGFNIRGTVGALGSYEMNMSTNMDYTTSPGVHRFYDNTKDATWLAIGDSFWQMQYAPASASAGDVWNNAGQPRALIQQTSTGIMRINTTAALSIPGSTLGDAMLGVRRTPNFASISGETDLVIEGAKTKGVSAPVYINSYNTGDVSVVAGGGKLGVGLTTSITALLTLAAGTTSRAQIKLNVGVAPTSPNDGDIWLESNTNTGLKIRIAGVTKTISLV